MQDVTTSISVLSIMGMSEEDERYQLVLAHAKTYVWMYKITGQRHYLDQAKQVVDTALTLRSGFMRPLGCFLKESA